MPDDRDFKYLERLAGRLSPLLPEWNTRVIDINGGPAVVLDLFPGQMVALHTVRDGQWWALNLSLDSNGEPLPSTSLPQRIGVRAPDIDTAVLRLVSLIVTSYREAANFQPSGAPADALFLGWKPHARFALERLTHDRFS